MKRDHLTNMETLDTNQFETIQAQGGHLKITEN